MSATVGILVAGALLAGAGPRGRRLDARTSRGPRAGAAEGRLEAVARVAAAQVGAARWWTRRSSGAGAAQLAEVLAAVSAALRSGCPPGEAWRQTLGSPTGIDGLPDLGSLRALDHSPGGQGRHAVAVLAACRLARSLGAPLAPVLDRVAEAVAADDEVDAERLAALAGPRATAAVLRWLPVLGVLLGFALGADPVAVVLRGGAGAASAVLGGVLLLLGRWWTVTLLNRATSAGEAG